MYIIVVDLYHIKVTAEYSLLLADKIELEGEVQLLVDSSVVFERPQYHTYILLCCVC